ncbi:PfkB family carbohydrate kinase [Actinomyces culturomici]|uniref:PfkB family carbohydrate kinase n=1 Tax=Actinomyces culturomici TaxID=1926276 RepID=UPI000E1FFA9C|nr:PfkB family carbohydrate kinase [Actinomyces culturomici]
MGRVIVVGSINQDVTVQVDRHPLPGETLHGRGVSYRLGGKGANQAAAAAHGGAETLFVGAVGSDAAGEGLRAELGSHGVDLSLLRTADATSGVAFIQVAASGENTIILDAGANGTVPADALEAVEGLGRGDVVVLQGEIPFASNAATVRLARASGARVVLNLAPVYEIAPEVLADVDVLVVNEYEAGLALDRPAPTSVEEALEAARALREKGVGSVVITLGKAGAVRVDAESEAHVPAIDLGPVVDTTGAGDAAVGVLAAALAAGLPFDEAVEAGMRAGSIAVLSPGAAASYTGIGAVVPR